MRKAHLVILLLFYTFSVSAQRTEQKVTFHTKNIPFSEFCGSLYKQTSVKVFFDEKQLKELKVSLDRDSIPVFAAVNEALEGTGLDVSVWHDNLVILPGEKLLTLLPAYNYKKNRNITNDSVPGSLTQSEERYITGRKSDVAQTLRIGFKRVINTRAQKRK